MKLAILDKLKAKAKAHKKIAVLVIVLLVAALLAGAFFGWREYQRRQTAQFAFETLKLALMPPNVEKLAKMADFNQLTTPLAAQIGQAFKFYKKGQDQARDIRQELQKGLLAAFLAGPAEESKKKDDEPESVELRKGLTVLPPDFVNQLIKNIALVESGENSALISAKISHPQLKQDFVILLRMLKNQDGWKIKDIVNARELVLQAREAMLKRHSRLREVYLEKNAATMKKMNDLLPIQACAVDAGLLSDGKSLLAVIQILARNRGSIQVNNFNADVSIFGKNGKMIARRFLNAAKPVAPGEDFNHRWTMELDGHSDLARELLAASPLSCKASWQTLGLGNSQVWHIEELPNPDRNCQTDGHDHPEGFCLIPVFAN